MVGHLLRAAIPTVLGLGLVLLACNRWFRYKNTERNFAVLALATLVLVGIQSQLAMVTTVRCPYDKSQWCEFNDSVPAMVTTVAAFVVLSMIRAWTLYENR